MKTKLLNSKITIMKRIFSIVAIAAVMVACNRNPAATVDAIELAEFKAWKAENEKVAAATALVAASKSATTARRTASSNTTYRSPVKVSETQYPAKAPAKKGISKAAKGAIIGGVAGGVAGAVIHKRNRAVGAVVGAVIGGGVGYGVGRHMDKKDGRYLVSGYGY
jgi:uncharacterized protein YcfJ